MVAGDATGIILAAVVTATLGLPMWLDLIVEYVSGFAFGLKTDATTPQVSALGIVSVIALAIGMAAPANWLNLTLSARDVGGVIMPRGMIMGRDTPAEAMRDMAAADPRRVTASYDLSAKGGQELPFRLENGVKVFELRPSVIRWQILPNVAVDAYAYNGQIPQQRSDPIQTLQPPAGRPDVATVASYFLIIFPSRKSNASVPRAWR